jgi:adenylate cyclase
MPGPNNSSLPLPPDASLSFSRAETTCATVLFADLRGYTGLAEVLQPVRVAGLLDEFFDVLTRATERNGGEVFHMAGDSMMAGFGIGAPLHRCAREALNAGHAMLRNFAPIGLRWRQELAVDTGIGIGVHQGEVAICLHGPSGRQARTLVGDTVNVAARLCGRARAGEVLFSAAVASALEADGPPEKAGAPMQILHLPQLRLRGRSALIDIWCVPAAKRVLL